MNTIKTKQADQHKIRNLQTHQTKMQKKILKIEIKITHILQGKEDEETVSDWWEKCIN